MAKKPIMNTRKIAGTGIFTALTIVFTLISNYLPVGSISINLSLVPIAIAGILYGPLSGFFVGLVNGAFVMVAPSTQAFFAVNVGATIFICLTKTSMAGLLSSLLYKLIKKKNDLAGMITASLVVPVINTGLFLLGALVFFNNMFGNIVSIFLLINFAIEMGFSIILSPATCKAILHIKRSNKNKIDA